MMRLLSGLLGRFALIAAVSQLVTSCSEDNGRLILGKCLCREGYTGETCDVSLYSDTENRVSIDNTQEPQEFSSINKKVPKQTEAKFRLKKQVLNISSDQSKRYKRTTFFPEKQKSSAGFAAQHTGETEASGAGPEQMQNSVGNTSINTPIFYSHSLNGTTYAASSSKPASETYKQSTSRAAFKTVSSTQVTHFTKSTQLNDELIELSPTTQVNTMPTSATFSQNVKPTSQNFLTLETIKKSIDQDEFSGNFSSAINQPTSFTTTSVLEKLKGRETNAQQLTTSPSDRSTFQHYSRESLTTSNRFTISDRSALFLENSVNPTSSIRKKTKTEVAYSNAVPTTTEHSLPRITLKNYTASVSDIASIFASATSIQNTTYTELTEMMVTTQLGSTTNADDSTFGIITINTNSTAFAAKETSAFETFTSKVPSSKQESSKTTTNRNYLNTDTKNSVSVTSYRTSAQTSSTQLNERSTFLSNKPQVTTTESASTHSPLSTLTQTDNSMSGSSYFLSSFSLTNRMTTGNVVVTTVENVQTRATASKIPSNNTKICDPGQTNKTQDCQSVSTFKVIMIFELEFLQEYENLQSPKTIDFTMKIKQNVQRQMKGTPYVTMLINRFRSGSVFVDSEMLFEKSANLSTERVNSLLYKQLNNLTQLVGITAGDKNECSDSYVCGSNASCENTDGSYVCQCRVGFADVAEKNASVTTSAPQCQYLCDDFSCLNFGKCMVLSNNTPICRCAYGYSGSKCEIMVITPWQEMTFALGAILGAVILSVLFACMCQIRIRKEKSRQIFSPPMPLKFKSTSHIEIPISENHPREEENIGSNDIQMTSFQINQTFEEEEHRL